MQENDFSVEITAETCREIWQTAIRICLSRSTLKTTKTWKNIQSLPTMKDDRRHLQPQHVAWPQNSTLPVKYSAVAGEYFWCRCDANRLFSGFFMGRFHGENKAVVCVRYVNLEPTGNTRHQNYTLDKSKECFCFFRSSIYAFNEILTANKSLVQQPQCSISWFTAIFSGWGVRMSTYLTNTFPHALLNVHVFHMKIHKIPQIKCKVLLKLTQTCGFVT